MIRTSSQTIALASVAVLISALAACSNGVPLGPSDAATQAAVAAPTTTTTPTPAPAAPTPATPTPTPTTPTAVAYTDLTSLFATDCTPCHGTRPAARYSTTSYAGVMAAVRAGNASSPLVIVTQPGGIMYGFLSGDRVSKAALIRTWVLNGAPQNR